MRLESTPGKLTTSVAVACSPDEAFAVISDPSELNELTPDWFTLTVDPTAGPDQPVGVGTTFTYWLRLGRVRFRWASEIDEWAGPRAFSYVQSRGPYRYFRHDHQVDAVSGGSSITDVVEYRLWSGPLGHRTIVLPMLRSVFEHRAHALRDRFGGL